MEKLEILLHHVFPEIRSSRTLISSQFSQLDFPGSSAEYSWTYCQVPRQVHLQFKINCWRFRSLPRNSNFTKKFVLYQNIRTWRYKHQMYRCIGLNLTFRMFKEYSRNYFINQLLLMGRIFSGIFQCVQLFFMFLFHFNFWTIAKNILKVRPHPGARWEGEIEEV